MDLSTTYLGLPLRSPLVASAGPLTERLDSLRALQDAGVAAVVLPSLFEEQAAADADRALRRVEAAKAALHVPVIASLNGATLGGWTRYARRIEDAGADALELNLYRVAADPTRSGGHVEDEQAYLVATVAAALTIPLAVKVGPYYSAFAHMATRLATSGADGLVLFNRFYQPDLDPETGTVVSALELSTSTELRLPLRWIGLLHGRVDADLAASSGIASGQDVAKVLLAGADVAMMTSALLRYGAGHVSTVEAELRAWGDARGYASVAQLRGRASHRRVSDPAAFERANYLEVLDSYGSADAP